MPGTNLKHWQAVLCKEMLKINTPRIFGQGTVLVATGSNAFFGYKGNKQDKIQNWLPLFRSSQLQYVFFFIIY
jgi:hypothetical protein